MDHFQRAFSYQLKLSQTLDCPFENCINLTGKYLCWSLFLIHWCFPVRFCKFFRRSFFTGHLRWLLLKGFCEGASLVKILEFCHFDIFGINNRCFRKIDMPLKKPIKKNSEYPRLLKGLLFFLLIVKFVKRSDQAIYYSGNNQF